MVLWNEVDVFAFYVQAVLFGENLRMCGIKYCAEKPKGRFGDIGNMCLRIF